MGGSVKSNAAASQSSGRRGILLSLLLPLLFMLMLMLMLLLLLTGTDSAPASTGENAVAR